MAFRMTEQAYLVLLVLGEGPRHGYAIVQGVAELTDGRVRLGAGTLYGVLDRLVEAGYARVSGEEVIDGRLRRYYALTDEGGAAAAVHTKQMAALLVRARRALAPRPALGGA